MNKSSKKRKKLSTHFDEETPLKRKKISFSGKIHFMISQETKEKLLKIFKKSIKTQKELSGHFIPKILNEQNVELTIQEDSILIGRQEDGYSLCGNDDNDYEFTFHCHPIECDKYGNVINIPNLVSNEDMIGVVQDSYKNTGYLSNKNGKNIFDILCCPMGIFVYSAEEKIINKWIECEDVIDQSNVEYYYKKFFDSKFKLEKFLKKEGDLNSLIEKIKNFIQNDKSKKNPFWAVEENSLMNDQFNAYLGSWYYQNDGKSVFSKIILPKFQHLGYQIWFKDQKTKSDKRANLKFKEQKKWFFSEEFYSINYKNVKLLQDYLNVMRDLGFSIQFFNWRDHIHFEMNV